MATLKSREIIKMGKEELEKKFKELKMELVKSRSSASKSGKTKEIKKIIARVMAKMGENS